MKVKKYLVICFSVLLGFSIGLISAVIFEDYIIDGSFIIVFELIATFLSYAFITVSKSLYE